MTRWSQDSGFKTEFYDTTALIPDGGLINGVVSVWIWDGISVPEWVGFVPLKVGV